MLQIVIPEKEYFDDRIQEFVHQKRQVLQLEHSLISLSKWESKWKKPFIGKDAHTVEETIDYIRCMTITQGVDYAVYEAMDNATVKKIVDYISDPQTATKIYDRRQRPGGRSETMTSEMIYYYMVYYGIPFECEKWPLNRLLMLIRICSIKGTNEMMNKQSLFAQNRALNSARRSALHSRG